MGRPLRIERAGGWYHVTGRGNERKAIYRDNRDRFRFLGLLAGMVKRFGVVLHGYQLMDNHYHLIVELREKNLSGAGHWLNVSYSSWFNVRHRRSGHLFQGRFKSVVVDPAEWAFMKGNAREQRGAARLARARPKLSEVIAALEKLRGQSWPEFRDRHGDRGRDLVLFLGQRVCALKLGELAAAAGMSEYSAASIAIRRFEKRLKRSNADRELLKRLCQMLNVAM